MSTVSTPQELIMAIRTFSLKGLTFITTKQQVFNVLCSSLNHKTKTYIYAHIV